MKVVFKILLLICIGVLVYVCVESIMEPIRFTEVKDARDKAIIARLVDIRKAQIEYKNRKGVHAANFNELINFLKNENLPFIIKEGILTDEQLQSGLTEKEAVKKGIIKRDTFWVNAKDTLFGKTYNVDSLGFVPFTNNAMFLMDTATITSASGYTVKVFEASVEDSVYLWDQNPQEIANLYDAAKKLDKFPGLKVGSTTEINNYAGNWE